MLARRRLRPEGSGTGRNALIGSRVGRARPLASVPSRPAAVFAVTALGAFMVSLDLSIVNVAFPALTRAFPGDTRASLAWVITAYAIVFGSLLITAGRSADRLGRRRAFFIGLAVFTIGSALCGGAPSVLILVAGRVVQGVGGAFLLPASLGLLLDALPETQRAQAVALWAGVGALAVATGPSLGAAIIQDAGWRWAFYVNLPVGILAWASGRVVLPRRDAPAGAGSADYLGVLLVSGSLGGLVLGISEGPTWGWASPSVLGAFTVAAAGLGGFVARCARRRDPVLDLSLFRHRSFSVANAATLAYAMGFFAMLLGNILFLTGVWHYGILRAGLAVTPGPVMVAVTSGPAGAWARRAGFRRVLLAGFGVFAAGLGWYAARAGVGPSYLAVWLPGTLITGVGIGLTFPVLAAASVASLPPAHYAVGSAVNQTARQIGGAIGVAVLVVILGPAASGAVALAHFRHLWLYSCAMVLLAGAFSTRLTAARRGG